MEEQEQKIQDDPSMYKGLFRKVLYHIKDGADGLIKVTSTPNRAFTEQAQDIGGRFDENTATWSFLPEQRDEVGRLCQSVYDREFTTVTRNGELHVTAPDSPEFAEGARLIGGRYDDTTNQWVFLEQQKNTVDHLCQSIGDKHPYDIIAREDKVIVIAPEDKDFAQPARSIGGRYDESLNSWSFPKEKLQSVKAISAKAFPKPYHIGVKGNDVTVKAPYSKDFVECARSIGGKFDKTRKTWTFTKEQLPVVKKMCNFAFDKSITKGALTKSMGKLIVKAKLAAMQALPAAGQALMAVMKVAILAGSYGYSGARGVSTAQSMINLASGSIPKLKPDRIDTGGGVPMGGQELFLEQQRLADRAPALAR